MYDFDTPVERHGTDCLKFDSAEERHRSPDLLSLWVADMDFPTAPEILDAICARTHHGIFGYTVPGPAYFEALDQWCTRRYGWNVPAEQVTFTPGGGPETFITPVGKTERGKRSPEGQQGYIPHWVTCPQADRFRRKEKRHELQEDLCARNRLHKDL